MLVKLHSFVPLFLLLLTLGGCENESNLDAPRVFFAKEKIGKSPDYGVIKWKNSEDHVVTVHGFVDDFEACLKISEFLNQDACNSTFGKNCLNPFSCTPLNH